MRAIVHHSPTLTAVLHLQSPSSSPRATPQARGAPNKRILSNQASAKRFLSKGAVICLFLLRINLPTSEAQQAQPLLPPASPPTLTKDGLVSQAQTTNGGLHIVVADGVAGGITSSQNAGASVKHSLAEVKTAILLSLSSQLGSKVERHTVVSTNDVPGVSYTLTEDESKKDQWPDVYAVRRPDMYAVRTVIHATAIDSNNSTITVQSSHRDISVHATGFTPTDNAIQFISKTDSSRIYDYPCLPRAPNGSMIVFSIPTEIPDGDYYVKVGAFNSDWSAPIEFSIKRSGFEHDKWIETHTLANITNILDPRSVKAMSYH